MHINSLIVLLDNIRWPKQNVIPVITWSSTVFYQGEIYRDTMNFPFHLISIFLASHGGCSCFLSLIRAFCQELNITKCCCSTDVTRLWLTKASSLRSFPNEKTLKALHMPWTNEAWIISLYKLLQSAQTFLFVCLTVHQQLKSLHPTGYSLDVIPMTCMLCVVCCNAHVCVKW